MPSLVQVGKAQRSFVLARTFDERGNGETAHQFGDVIDEVGIRRDVVRFRCRRAQRLEQDGQATVHRFLFDRGIACAVVMEQAETEGRARHARDAHHQRVRRAGILLLHLRVTIGLETENARFLEALEKSL